MDECQKHIEYLVFLMEMLNLPQNGLRMPQNHSQILKFHGGACPDSDPLGDCWLAPIYSHKHLSHPTFTVTSFLHH